MRWVVVGFIGFFTGLVAFLLDYGMSTLLKSKFNMFNKGMWLLGDIGTLVTSTCHSVVPHVHTLLFRGTYKAI